MGGRGGSSGLIGRNSDLGLSQKQIEQLVDSAIDFIRGQPRAYASLTAGSEADYRRQIQKAYEDGWSGLQDGAIININPKNQNQYVVKEGDKAVWYVFSPTSSQRYLNIKNNVVVGYKGRKTSEKELDVEKKRFYVRRHVLISLIPRRML